MKYRLISLIALCVAAQININLLEGTNSLNVTLQNYEQISWFVNISIGYPNQYFQVVLDTGSNILWVPETNCKFCAIHTRYNPQGQASFAPNGSSYFQAYGSGECSGIVASDTVSIVGSPMNDTFMMMFATYENGFANPNVFDGIMGVSNNQTYTNLFQASYQAGQIETELYAVALNQAPYDSYLFYGTIDQSLLNQAIWVIPDDLYRWKLFINTFTVNGVDYSEYMGKTTSAILDTGTTEMTVTPQLFYIMLKDFFYPAGCTYNGQLECPCNPSGDVLANMPNITVAFNQVTVTIPYYNMIQYFYQSTDQDTCWVMFGYEEGASFMIFGDPALMSFIPVFNKTQNIIGIIGGEANSYPNGDYPGNDEIDESYATY